MYEFHLIKPLIRVTACLWLIVSQPGTSVLIEIIQAEMNVAPLRIGEGHLPGGKSLLAAINGAVSRQVLIASSNKLYIITDTSRVLVFSDLSMFPSPALMLIKQLPVKGKFILYLFEMYYRNH